MQSRAVGSSFRLGGGGAEREGRRPEEIFKFRVSEMPFPGLWGRFDRFLMVKMVFWRATLCHRTNANYLICQLTDFPYLPTVDSFLHRYRWTVSI